MNIILLKPLKHEEHIFKVGTGFDLSEAKALRLIELGYARKTPSQDASPCPDPSSGQIPSPEEPITEPETALADFDTITERIGIRFDGPEVSGEPVLFHPEDGRPIAYTSDPPHIRLFAWALMNVSHVITGSLDAARIARDCRLTASEVRGALARLLKDGDLIRTVERKRELYRLQIKYS